LCVFQIVFDIKNVSSLPFTATDVDVFIISPTDLVFTPSGGTFPLIPTLSTGSSQTITSCIESTTSTFPSTATDIVFGYRLRYNAGDTCCYESVLDTIAIPPCDSEPDECFSVVDIEAKNVICDAPDCYNDPYCQAWLVDKITNAACFGVAATTVEKAFYNGSPIFIIKEQYYDTDIETIYDCDGTIIQACSSWMGLPTTCNPNVGINIATDLTSVQLVWDCNMPIPVYDPMACLGSASGLTQVDYCVKIMNNSPTGYLANQFDLSGISPSGVTITPTSHTQNIPSGGMATINFSISGNLSAGDIVKIEGLLSGLDSMEEPWECLDTICLEVPPCPIDSCCTDEDQFLADIAQGFQVTQLGDCTYQVCANQFDTCHYFGTLGPDWGDGSVTLPAINQSNPPNNCWTHTYTTNGSFKIAIHLYEGDPANEESCWDADLCTTIETDCCDEDPCDDISVTTTSISTTADSCCTMFTIDNAFCDDYFKGIRVEIPAPGSVSQINALGGYVVNQISPQVAEVRPLFGFVGVGVRDVFTLCTTGYTTNPHTVTVNWLVPDGAGGCTAECPTDHEISCDPPVPDKCYELVEDSIHCESNTYCFKIKNTSSPAFDINSVHLYDLSGTLGLSPSGRMTIPTLTSGNTSGWICVTYNGVIPGDNACFKISAHNTPANIPPSTCCTDTLETCFIVPECDNEVCGTCPDGSVGGPNLVTNGDFEQGTGYAGWTSGHNLESAGILGANEYSVRNSTNLVNTQWRATDHTTNSVNGQFLAIDGPSPNVAYSTSVTVMPNTDYVFCMWVDNLVSTSTPSDPVIEVKIGGTIVEAGRWLPKTPDGWQLITLNYTSTTGGTINIEVSDIATTTQFNDWAIDDVSFRACEPVDDCCDDIDPQDIINYYNANITVLNNECQGCVTVDLDSCDIAFVDFGNGEIQLTDLTPECQTFMAGNHPFTIRVVRLDINGDICFEETFTRSFDIDCPPVVDCCDVDVADILLYYGLNTTVDRDSCDVCISIDVDSCDVFEFRYDNGPFVTYSGSFTECKSYTDPGPHFYSYRVTRFDMNGDTCFHDTFNAQFDLLCDTISDPDPCCDDLDVPALDAYYVANTSFGTSDCAACVIVNLDSCDVGTVTFSGGSPQPLSDNTQSCMQYTTSGSYNYLLEIVRYDMNGDTCYYYQDQHTFDLVCDDEPPVHPCVQIVADSIDCETNTYCFRVRNNTTPGWTIRSLAFVNESAGHTLTPDPVSITPLAVGDTTDWICVNYTAFVADTVCFNLVAHQEDIAAGEEPQFCCSNPEPVCFVVPDCQKCLMCPDSTSIQGPNLVMNPDFESGYTGFTSDYTQVLTGILGADEYSIRNSLTLDNPQWTATDHTTGSVTGNFLVLDGPSNNVAYRTMVPVKPNTQYIYCMRVANLVNSDIDSDPTLRVDIDGVTQIPGMTIPQIVGRWWVISVPYFSGSNSGMLAIEVTDIDTDPHNDWAMDDVSFKECIVEKVCCEDEDLFDDLLDIGWTVSITDCSVTVSAPQLDSCHWISQSEPDWGDGSVAGQVITSAVGSWTHTYSSGGTYTICATIFEGDNPDDACFSGEMCVDVDMSDCPEPPQPPCTANDLTIYNAITPNGDGLNDNLFINGGDDCIKDIQVYNRWGQLVWSQKDYKNDWTGQSFNGEQLPDGTYFLVLEFPELTDKEERMKQTYIELRN